VDKDEEQLEHFQGLAREHVRTMRKELEAESRNRPGSKTVPEVADLLQRAIEAKLTGEEPPQQLDSFLTRWRDVFCDELRKLPDSLLPEAKRSLWFPELESVKEPHPPESIGR